MHVVATAGHVDHGKSTLVRALTGMEPDRYAEERRRGLTIDLGFAWMQLADGTSLAFVDVPGHERFVSTMLAGIGPVPAVLLVVAADGGWSAQTAEHVAVLDALDVAAGLVVVTRSDLADPGPVRGQVSRRLAGTSLAAIPFVTCSAITGVGIDDVRDALARLVGGLPAPDLDAATRLWIDRSFTIRGAGTVITGTLAAGQIRTGEELIVARTGRVVVIRGLECLNQPVPAASAVARVAVNLRGVSTEDLRRGDALLSPRAWAVTNCADVRTTSAGHRLPAELTMHIGSAAVGVRTRRLGERGLRLTMADSTALTYGDRVLLRDPGSRRIVAADVLDPLPAQLERRRGAAARRASELVEMSRQPDPDAELRRRGIMKVATFDTLGLGRPATDPVDGWFIDPHARNVLAERLNQLATDYQKQNPLASGLSVGAAARLLDLPDEALLSMLLRAPWRLESGRFTSRDQSAAGVLPAEVQAKVDEVNKRLQLNTFDAPTATELASLGLTAGALAAAVRAGQLIAIGADVYLTAEAPEIALRRLAELPQPFTTSEARIALETSRRVALPLLQWLDTSGATRRLPDDRRHVSAAIGQPPRSN